METLDAAVVARRCTAVLLEGDALLHLLVELSHDFRMVQLPFAADFRIAMR